MFRPSPLTQKRLRRFRSIKRGWWSFIFLVFLYVLSLAAELLVHHRALVVKYEGQLHFPTYGAIIPGTEFGESMRMKPTIARCATGSAPRRVATGS